MKPDDPTNKAQDARARRTCPRREKCQLSHPPTHSLRLQHVYEVRPRKDKRGVGLISDALPFGRLSLYQESMTPSLRSIG